MAYIGLPPSNSFVSLKRQVITGNGGSTYTLDHSVASVNDVAIFVNNVRQDPASYSISGTALTLGGTISSSDSCYVIFLGQALQTVTPATGTVTNAMLGETITVAKGGTGLTSGFKNGINMADQWRLTADIVNTDGVITSNLERVDDGAFGYIGTGMTESSGIFSFPSTGLYLIHATMESVSQTDGVVLNLQISVDNFSNALTEGTITQGDGDSHATNFASGSKIIFFNVTDTSTHKARFNIGSATASTVRGNSSLNETCFTFIRLGDSV